MTLQSGTPSSVSAWVQQGSRWNDQEKRAVRNLIFNYMNVVVPRIDDLSVLSDLGKLAQNWEEAMSRLEIPVNLFRG